MAEKKIHPKLVELRQVVDSRVERIAKSMFDEIKKGRVTALAYVVVNGDGTLRFGYTRTRSGYALVGAIESLKHDLLHGMAES